MNYDQIMSLVRSIMKIVAGILAAHGLQNEATLLNTPDIIAATLAIASLVWSHCSHLSPPDGNAPTGKLTSILIIGFLGATLGATLTGCASLQPGADPLVVRAEQAQATGQAAFDLALELDNSNRDFYSTNTPAFHAFCQWLRQPQDYGTNSLPRAEVMILQLDDLKTAYKSDSIYSNSLLAGVLTLETAATQAASWSNVLTNK
jgi:hypothetical protein